MTTAPAAAPRARVGAPATWPWWAQVLAVQALARLVSAGVLLAVAARQAENLWTPAAPSYAQYAGLMWDASWYRGIVEDGYPAELPVGDDGRVRQNAWAFFPLFPLLARAVMAVTGQPWTTVAPTLALALGTGGLLLVHRTVSRGAAAAADRGIALPARVVRGLPLATVAVLATGAASPVLQVAYTESLALVLLAAVLWCLLARRYVLAVPLVLLLGLTRAVALPVVVAVLAQAWHRHREQGARPWEPGERARLAGLALVAAASGLLWPGVVGLATGRPDAYALTQAAWRGRGEVVPLLPWLDVARWLAGPWAPVLLGVVAAGLAALLLTRPLARLGGVLRGWTAGYLGYLVLVLEPGTSLVRFGLLAYPVAAVTAQLCLRSRWPHAVLGLVLALGVLAQVAWVGLLWRLVPPSGWPP